MPSKVDMSVNNYDEIIPNLFLGGYKALEDYKKFDLIINCTKDIEFPSSNLIICKYIRLPVNDEPDEANKLKDLLDSNNVLEIINKYLIEKKNVLVHCKMGQQRSAIVISCYLMKYFYISSDEAIEYVKAKRPIAFFGQVNFIDILSFFYIN